MREEGGAGREKTSPPGLLNVLLAAVLLAALIALQWLAAHVASAGAVWLVGALFALLLLTLNALIHEAEHCMLAANRVLNETVGVCLSLLFPSSLAFTRHTHLGHHRRNRTDDELFDQYYPDQSRAAKRLAFYTLYLGAFWLSVPLGTLAVALVPRALWRRVGGGAGRAMVAGMSPALVWRIRAECLLVAGAQAGLFALLDLRLATWAVLYGMAGVVWSSQQGLVHAGTRRHVVEGARDLAMAWPVEVLLLRSNRHLTHHRHPRVPWIHLPRFAGPASERAGYGGTFLRFWRGPRPCVEAAPARGSTSPIHG